eukprot:scaffold71774_cov21-Tisochrysis_lutea.AAC.1
MSGFGMLHYEVFLLKIDKIWSPFLYNLDDVIFPDWYCRELELQCLNSQTLVVDNTSKRAREPAHARARTHTHTHIHTHTGRERSGGSCARSATHSHSTLPACCAATTAATAEWSNCPGCRWPGCKAWEWD